MLNTRLIELTDRELQTVRGGDLCIVGYEEVDTDGDGKIDFIRPIYEQCSTELLSPNPGGSIGT